MMFSENDIVQGGARVKNDQGSQSEQQHEFCTLRSLLVCTAYSVEWGADHGTRCIADFADFFL